MKWTLATLVVLTAFLGGMTMGARPAGEASLDEALADEKVDARLHEILRAMRTQLEAPLTLPPSPVRLAGR